MQLEPALTVLLSTLWLHVVVQASQDAMELLAHNRRLLDAQQHGFLNVTLSHGKLAGRVITRSLFAGTGSSEDAQQNVSLNCTAFQMA